MIEAAHVEALEADRQRAPTRVQRAERCLTATPGLGVTTKVLKRDPEKILLEELQRWKPTSSSSARMDTVR